jgi:hypothetical protein
MKPLRQRLKRHQLAINDHRQALNPCKQLINALASSPDDLAILINTRADWLNPFAARPDDLESSKTPANPQFYDKRLDAKAHRFNLFTRHQSTNTPAI